MDAVVAMVEGVKALGMETCMTLGMLDPDQARRLKDAGLDYYNHNIDTSERYYGEVITTRTFADRLETLGHVREAGIKVCCGGIVGMGEEAADRVDMLVTLANLPEHPESVPINMLIPIEGTPLADAAPIEPIEFVRTIALARILMPKSHVRLSAGRTAMSDEMQALCFFAGANSIFVGDTLLTADNPGEDKDSALFRRLGIEPMEPAGVVTGRAPLDRYEATLRGLARKNRLRALVAACRARFRLERLSRPCRLAPACASAVARALAAGTPIGAGGSRLLRGNAPEHEALEAEAAAFFGAETRAVLRRRLRRELRDLLTTLPQTRRPRGPRRR